MSEQPFRYPLWSRGDIDGFFGLMVDNLMQVILIIALCRGLCGLPDSLIFDRLLPAVAVSLLIGNVFYGLQAHWVARRQRNPDCTALPYGINTPSVFAYALFVMAPVFASNRATLGDAAAADLAWKAGLIACLVSGIIEFLGAFFAESLRRATPRAALLGVLAAVGITFIAADFAFRIYAAPLVGLPPLALLLLAYFARYRFPRFLPGGLQAVLIGCAIAWGLTLLGQWLGAARLDPAAVGGVRMDPAAVGDAAGKFRFVPPLLAWDAIVSVLSRHELWLPYLTVSIPMGIINVLGSLQNIESAEAAGDRYATAPSLAVNGLGTIAAGLFGSCFPTTIYIGHPGWKALGARAGYSILNGAFFTVAFLLGAGPLLAALIPIEAGAAIVLYIGIIITAQAFQTTPREHAPAVAVALFPGLAAALVTTLGVYLAVSQSPQTLAGMVQNLTPATSALPGMLTLAGANSAWILVILILTAAAASLIDRRYSAAAIWCAAAAALTAVGMMHAYRLEGNDLRELFIWQAAPQASKTTYAYRALPIAFGYAFAAAAFALAGASARMQKDEPDRQD